MKAVIFTEGGKGIGFGHVIRCLAIRRAFERAGIKTELIVEGDRSVACVLGRERYTAERWRTGRAAEPDGLTVPEQAPSPSRGKAGGDHRDLDAVAQGVVVGAAARDPERFERVLGQRESPPRIDGSWSPEG